MADGGNRWASVAKGRPQGEGDGNKECQTNTHLPNLPHMAGFATRSVSRPRQFINPPPEELRSDIAGGECMRDLEDMTASIGDYFSLFVHDLKPDARTATY